MTLQSEVSNDRKSALNTKQYDVSEMDAKWKSEGFFSFIFCPKISAGFMAFLFILASICPLQTALVLGPKRNFLKTANFLEQNASQLVKKFIIFHVTRAFITNS
jgi:hypothetical protein